MRTVYKYRALTECATGDGRYAVAVFDEDCGHQGDLQLARTLGLFYRVDLKLVESDARGRVNHERRLLRRLLLGYEGQERALK